MSLRIPILLTALVALLCAPLAAAQADDPVVEPIGLDEVLVAIADAPAVTNALVQLETARLELEAAHSPLSASLGASADQAWNLAGASGGGLSASVSASATFDVVPYGPSADARVRAENAVTRARLQVDQARADTLATALDQYAEALRAAQETGIVELELALAERELAATRERFDAGAANDAQVLQAELAVASVGNDLAAARRDALGAALALAQTLGVAVDSVAGSIPVPTLPSGLDVAERVLLRYDVIEAELAVEEVRIALAAAHRNAAPSADLDLSYSGSTGGASLQLGAGFDTRSYQPSVSAGVGLSDAAGTASSRLSIGIGVSIPLDRANGTNIATSELSLEQAEAQRTRTIASAIAEIERLQRSLTGAEAQIELAQRLLEQAWSSLSDASTRLDLGLVSALAVQEAEIAALTAALQLDRAQDTYRSTALDLAAALALDPAEVLP